MDDAYAPPPADATDDEKRRALEEFQRQQAEKAVRESQANQPAGEVQNAVQRLAQQQPSQPSDYTERGLPAPTTVQGIISPSEQQFWEANPLGAVPHPITGELIGLGNDESTRQARLQQTGVPPGGFTVSGRGAAPPGTPGIDSRVFNPRSGQWEDQGGTSRREAVPDFINIPQVDPALQERRNQIQAALDENANRLRGASTTAGRGRVSDYARYSAERSQLMHASDSLGLEIHRQTQNYNQAVHQNSEMQKDYSTNMDSAAAGSALGKITAPLGSAERTQALANLPNQYPDARRDPRFDSRWLDEVKQNADHAAYMQYAQQNGLVPTMSHTGRGGVSYNYKPASQQEIADSEKELKPYHISLEQIRNPAQAKIVDENGNQNSAGNFVQLRGTGGSEKPSQIPMSLYQKYGGTLSQQDQAAQLSKTQPKGTAAPQTNAPVTVRVTSPDGKTGSIPTSQLQEALKQGYKQL